MKPKRTRRIIAHALKRGYEGVNLYATFHCTRCAYTEKKAVSNVKEINTGIGCPICNAPNPKLIGNVP